MGHSVIYAIELVGLNDERLALDILVVCEIALVGGFLKK
jgi:hypothetical protein